MKALVLTALLITSINHHTIAQNNSKKIRLARLVIDSTELETNRALLKEEIEASVRL
jgi:hypothetical protein